VVATAPLLRDARVDGRRLGLAVLSSPAVLASAGARVLLGVDAAAVAATVDVVHDAGVDLARLAAEAGLADAGRVRERVALIGARRLAVTVRAAVVLQACVDRSFTPAGVGVQGFARGALLHHAGRQVCARVRRDLAGAPGIAVAALARALAVHLDDLAVLAARHGFTGVQVRARWRRDLAAVAAIALVALALRAHALLAVRPAVDALAVGAAVLLAALVEVLALVTVPRRVMGERVDGLVGELALADAVAIVALDAAPVLGAGDVAADRVVHLALRAAVAVVADAPARVIGRGQRVPMHVVRARKVMTSGRRRRAWMINTRLVGDASVGSRAVTVQAVVARVADTLRRVLVRGRVGRGQQVALPVQSCKARRARSGVQSVSEGGWREAGGAKRRKGDRESGAHRRGTTGTGSSGRRRRRGTTCRTGRAARRARAPGRRWPAGRRRRRPRAGASPPR